MRVPEYSRDVATAAGVESLGGFLAALQDAGRSPKRACPDLPLQVAQWDSPLGPVLIAGDEKVVYLVEFWDRRKLDVQFETLRRWLGAVFFPGTSPAIEQMQSELDAYFQAGLHRFQTPVRCPGTELQEKVWEALRDVAPGTTWSYGELARRVGHPRAVRAVAQAVGKNRLAIVIPCHRIVGADGELTGYAGGLIRKRFLLAHEQAGRA